MDSEKKGLLEPESGDTARGGGAGRVVRKEGGGPAGRPPGRPPDAVNNSHRRTEDSLQARGIGPGRKSADVWRGLVVFPVCKPRILVALAARKAQSQVLLPALREGAPRNCPGGATCLPGSHLRPAVPMATGNRLAWSRVHRLVDPWPSLPAPPCSPSSRTRTRMSTSQSIPELRGLGASSINK